MNNSTTLLEVETEFRNLFTELDLLEKRVAEKVRPLADGKTLKGNERVGWLGEIYGKALFAGTLVHDREEHDFETPDGRRVSVKARKGWGVGWKKSSAIPKIDGPASPTHLLFVHLNDDYSIDKMWLFNWAELRDAGRFKKHIVRGVQRSFFFMLAPSKDGAHVIYPKQPESVRAPTVRG